MTWLGWFAAAVMAAGSAVLIWVLSTGMTWPGSGSVVALGLIGVGGGVIGLMARRRDSVGADENDDVEVTL